MDSFSNSARFKIWPFSKKEFTVPSINQSQKDASICHQIQGREMPPRPRCSNLEVKGQGWSHFYWETQHFYGESKNHMNQYQSISININQYQSISININQYQSISININQYQSISININQYQSISININQYQSIIGIVSSFIINKKHMVSCPRGDRIFSNPPRPGRLRLRMSAKGVHSMAKSRPQNLRFVGRWAVGNVGVYYVWKCIE